MKKLGKMTIILFLSLLMILIFLSHCVSFGTSPKQVDAFFREQPHQPFYRTYPSGNREMFYVEMGEPHKPLVLFVHGSPGDWTNFLSFMANETLLARARLVSVDRPGFGKSGRGRAERSIAQQAAHIKPILDLNTSGKPAILVGHSLGGPVIARLAMDYPDLVGGLILVAPSIDPDLEKIRWFQKPADWKIFSWMVPTDLVTANREILPLKAELQKMVPLWAQITIPTTVIQGEKDRLVPPGNADFAAKMLVNTSLAMVRIDGLNHFIPWNRPDLIEKAILHHLDLLAGTEVIPAVSSQ